LWDVCPNNQNSPHFRQQASNKEYIESDLNKQFRQKSRNAQASKPDTKNPQRSNEGGFKRKRGAPNVPKKDTMEMLTGWNTNKNGNRASPAAKHTIKTLYQLPSADKKRILPELQRALLVENIASKFVSSGNQDAIIQELRKLAGNDNIEKVSSPPKKKSKATSQPHQESQTTSAMMVTSPDRSSTPPAKSHNHADTVTSLSSTLMVFVMYTMFRQPILLAQDSQILPI
jgi:hypothetical protein